MNCPICRSHVAKGSNFCRRCGHQLPVVVGASFPYGIRFAHADGRRFSATLNQARQAPRYFSPVIDGNQFHVALFDRETLSDLALLHHTVFMSVKDPLSMIEHTTDGRTFFQGPSFWTCFSKRVAGVGVDFPQVAHSCARCHSYFGCIFAQGRQQHMYHREGWEVFYHGRHGTFGGGVSPAEEDFVYSGRATSEEISRILSTSAFVPDRAKIKAEVLRLITRAGANRCPLFSPMYLDRQIKKIPTAVFLSGEDRDPGWKFLNCVTLGPAAVWSCYREENRDLHVDPSHLLPV